MDREPPSVLESPAEEPRPRPSRVNLAIQFVARFPIGTVATNEQINDFALANGIYDAAIDTRETVRQRRHMLIVSIRRAVLTKRWRTDPTLPDPFYIRVQQPGISYVIVSTADEYNDTAGHSPDRIAKMYKSLQRNLDKLFESFDFSALSAEARTEMSVRKAISQTLVLSGMHMALDLRTTMDEEIAKAIKKIGKH